MTAVPMLNQNQEVSFDFLKEICVSKKSWEILESIKQEYERKIEKSADENDLLKKEIRRLENDKNKLEAEKEDLVNDVQDLRALLKRIHEEGEIQLDKLMKNNKELKEQVVSYKNALETSHGVSKHFDDMSFYWQENVSI